MKFIFPQNYSFSTKLFGVIDYSVAIFNVVLWVIIYFFLNLFLFNLYVKIIVFISISFPLLLISIIGLNHENILYVFSYIIKFIIKSRIYLYIKE